jgi:hypothetical protein
MRRKYDLGFRTAVIPESEFSECIVLLDGHSCLDQTVWCDERNVYLYIMDTRFETGVSSY